MSDRVVEVKNDSDEEPEEGEIQDDGFEDVSSDDEISSISRRDESAMYSHALVLHKVSEVKRQGICSPRSDVRFHVSEKLDHISQTSQKRPRPGLRPGEHDYYEMFHRYKSFKDHHSKGRIHEKENKARETKKLYKKSSLHKPSIESRSMYGGDHSEGRCSSTSKGSWHQCEVKEKHKKKKKSKSNKSHPLVEVHERQMICSQNFQVPEECLKTTTNMKEDTAGAKDEDERKKLTLGEVQSPSSSDIEILDVPEKIPEVITIADSDDDGQLQNLNKDDTELEVSGNPSLEVDDHQEPSEPNKKVECTNLAIESTEKAENSRPIESTEADENLELLREAALNSSKTEQSLRINPDYEVLQLRLAALRSAVIRKFEERKKRGITLAIRARKEGNHTMSISPLSSPNPYSSGESYDQESEEREMYQQFEEFVGPSGSTNIQNDSETDKITAIDMELVESDDEKEHVSVPSDRGISENVTPQFTVGCNFTSSDSSVKNSIERRSQNDTSKEMSSNSARQSISLSQSVIMHRGEFEAVGSGETTSGHIVSNSEKSSNVIRESHLPCESFYFNSELLCFENDNFLEINGQNKIQQPDSGCCGSHEMEHDIVKEKIIENMNSLQESNSQSQSLETRVEAHSLVCNSSEKETSADLLETNINESGDSCSTADLDLGSMIVLDEVGKCSDDNKSEGSILDVSGNEQQPGSHSSDGSANKGSCQVDSLLLHVRNTNVDRHVPQSSEKMNFNSESEEIYSELEMVLNRSEVKSSDTTFSQCSVNQNNLINCVERKDNIQQFHEHISVRTDSHDNHDSMNENICDKVLVKESNCSNCNSNSSDQCIGNAICEDFRNKQFSNEPKTKSNLSEQADDTSVESSETSRPLIANSSDQNINNTGHSSIQNVTFSFFIRNGEKLELGAKDKEETLTEFLNASESVLPEQITENNQTCDSLKIVSDLNKQNRINERDSHLTEKEIHDCSDKNNLLDRNNISMEEDEEVLRLSLLAMLDKKSEDTMTLNSLSSSPQNIDAKENRPSSANITCDSGHVENIILEPQAKKAALPPSNAFSSLKSTKGNVLKSQLLPSKSSCVKPKVSPLHLSLPTHTKPVFPGCNKLTSVNKRVLKTNKTRMVKSGSSGRSKISVPPLVINLGEDSDSGDDASELHVVNESNNAPSELLDSQSTSQVVTPDFAKKLDLLLKQARFEQEGYSSEDKDDGGDNDIAELTKHINVGSMSSKEVSKSLGGATENSSVSDFSTQGVPVDKESVAYGSCASDLSNAATTNDNTVSVMGDMTTINRRVTRKISSPMNVKKTVTLDGKKNIASNFVSSSLPVVDIGLLPSGKQKEYLRLKKQLAQFAQKIDAKSKENQESKNILGSTNRKDDTTFERVVRKNVIKNDFGANIDRTSIARKLSRKVQVCSQTSRNEIIKPVRVPSTSLNRVLPQLLSSPERKIPLLQKNITNTSVCTRKATAVPYTSTTKQKKSPNIISSIIKPVRVPSTSTNRILPQLLSSPERKIPLIQRKVTNTSVCNRKATAISFISTTKQKKSPNVVSRFSTGKPDVIKQIACNKFVMKSSQQRREIDPGSVTKSSVTPERSLPVKRKKSISESGSLPLCKKGPLKLQTGIISTFDEGENTKNEGLKATCANKQHENNTNRDLVEELWMSENKLMTKRYQVLEDLAGVRAHLHEIERVRIMKQQILVDIKILREKIHFAESQLSQKDELLNTLYSEVEDGKRNIMRGQSETLLLSVECEEKGCKVHGPDYSVPNACTEMIRDGMLSISKSLQNLKETNISIHSICGMSPFSSSGEAPPAEDNVQPVSGSVDNTNDEEKKQVSHSYSSPLEAIRTESGSDFQRFLCPYFIMGTCKDKECPYLH